MIFNNAMKYNPIDSHFYEEAVRMKEEAQKVFENYSSRTDPILLGSLFTLLKQHSITSPSASISTRSSKSISTSQQQSLSPTLSFKSTFEGESTTFPTPRLIAPTQPYIFPVELLRSPIFTGGTSSRPKRVIEILPTPHIPIKPKLRDDSDDLWTADEIKRKKNSTIYSTKSKKPISSLSSVSSASLNYPISLVFWFFLLFQMKRTKINFKFHSKKYQIQ